MGGQGKGGQAGSGGYGMRRGKHSGMPGVRRKGGGCMILLLPLVLAIVAALAAVTR